MDHEIALAALRLLTRLFEASKAFLELLRQHRESNDHGKEAHTGPRHLKK
ncbi:MAG: hypothetical protein Q4C09_01040 [Atopobiaceae bacterium]|nr:hypothetical protein [Atopobiaceae bacterium]